MKISLDIPDKIHLKLARRAKKEGITLNNLLVRSVQTILDGDAKSTRRLKLPLIDSKRPGSLHLGNAKIYELIDFP